jgi:hypothetical protein
MDKINWYLWKIIYEFSVYYSGWDCDETAWVVENKNTGERRLKVTDHGRARFGNNKYLKGKINELETAIQDYKKAILMLTQDYQLGRKPQ